MKEILLHSCCAPCSSAIIEWMLNNDVKPTIYYCNPNIYPEEEYIIRKNEITRYADKLGLTIIDADYDHAMWKDYVCNGVKEKGGNAETQPERGLRCLECFKLRLLRTAIKCKELGIDEFTTTLASSRWKSLDQINEAGRWAAIQVNKDCGEVVKENNIVVFNERNWRKGGLQDRRNQLLKENNFYNQLYCGCEFSMRQDK